MEYLHPAAADNLLIKLSQNCGPGSYVIVTAPNEAYLAYLKSAAAQESW